MTNIRVEQVGFSRSRSAVSQGKTVVNEQLRLNHIMEERYISNHSTGIQTILVFAITKL